MLVNVTEDFCAIKKMHLLLQATAPPCLAELLLNETLEVPLLVILESLFKNTAPPSVAALPINRTMDARDEPILPAKFLEK